MQCEKIGELLGAYRDGELSAAERDAVAAHLESCKACNQALADYDQIGRAIKRQGRETAPAMLAVRIGDALDRVDAVAHETAPSTTVRLLPVRPVSGMLLFAQRAAALAAVCILSVSATWWTLDTQNRNGMVERDILNAHLRSLLQDSPVQVVSSDQHTVQPWFAGRTDFAPEIKDLAPAGFPLLGGRLDYVADRRVGVVVYKRRLHIINVFMWPAPTNADRSPQATMLKGYNLLSWSRNGVSYRAVSDLNIDELRMLGREL